MNKSSDWIKYVKIGDKVRYLGGDPLAINNLSVGKEYTVTDNDDLELTIKDDDGDCWLIGYSLGNNSCFEHIPKSPATASTKTEEDMLVSLAQEVTTLKRRLSDLKQEIDLNRLDTLTWSEESAKMAYKMAELIRESDERFEMLVDDVAMLDERTQILTGEAKAPANDSQDANKNDPQIARKTVTYEYE